MNFNQWNEKAQLELIKSPSFDHYCKAQQMKSESGQGCGKCKLYIGSPYISVCRGYYDSHKMNAKNIEIIVNQELDKMIKRAIVISVYLMSVIILVSALVLRFFVWRN